MIETSTGEWVEDLIRKSIILDEENCKFLPHLFDVFAKITEFNSKAFGISHFICSYGRPPVCCLLACHFRQSGLNCTDDTEIDRREELKEPPDFIFNLSRSLSLLLMFLSRKTDRRRPERSKQTARNFHSSLDENRWQFFFDHRKVDVNFSSCCWTMWRSIVWIIRECSLLDYLGQTMKKVFIVMTTVSWESLVHIRHRGNWMKKEFKNFVSFIDFDRHFLLLQIANS